MVDPTSCVDVGAGEQQAGRAQLYIRYSANVISFTSLTKGFINPKVYPIIMSKEEVKGKGKQIKGKIREEVGKLTDNKTEQLKGKIEKAEGKAEEEIGKAKRKAKD